MPKNEKLLDAFKEGFIKGFKAHNTRSIITQKYAENALNEALTNFESTLNKRYSFTDEEHNTNSPSQ